MKTFISYLQIFSTFSFILSFSACSISAKLLMSLVLTRDPKTLILSVSIAVLANKTRAFSTRRGWFCPGLLLRRKPLSKNESAIELPNFLIIWIDSNVAFGSARIFMIASTQILAKKSLCWVSNFELNVVLAMLKRSFRNFSSSEPLSWATSSRASRATATAFFQPKIFYMIFTIKFYIFTWNDGMWMDF